MDKETGIKTDDGSVYLFRHQRQADDWYIITFMTLYDLRPVNFFVELSRKINTAVRRI